MVLRFAGLVLALGSALAAETTPQRFALAPPGQGENGDWAFFGRYRQANNDLAGNNGPERDAEIEGAIASMVEIARANRIKVVLASIPPAADFAWHPGSKPIPRLLRLNAWLKSYASQAGIEYVDYWPVLAAQDGSMKAACSPDGVHPNSACYRAMQPLTLSAIAAATRP